MIFLSITLLYTLIVMGSWSLEPATGCRTITLSNTFDTYFFCNVGERLKTTDSPYSWISIFCYAYCMSGKNLIVEWQKRFSQDKTGLWDNFWIWFIKSGKVINTRDIFTWTLKGRLLNSSSPFSQSLFN